MKTNSAPNLSIAQTILITMPIIIINLTKKILLAS